MEPTVSCITHSFGCFMLEMLVIFLCMKNNFNFIQHSLYSGNCFNKHENEPPTWSMERLIGKEVNRGDGAKILLRGEARRVHVSTQVKMGTVTQSGLCTPLDMFEGRGPVWMPEPLLFWCYPRPRIVTCFLLFRKSPSMLWVSTEMS